jgi:hypothetical protein
MEGNLTLIHPNKFIQISYRLLNKNSNRIPGNPVLGAFPCTLKSQASIIDFQQLIPALEAKTVKTTHDNFRDLTACLSELHNCE